MRVSSSVRSIIFLVLLLTVCSVVNAQKKTMYIGTYTSGSKSDGVYVVNFDESNGTSEIVKSIKMSNPSFLARKGEVLYAVNEDAEGMITAYDLKADKILSQMPTKGAHPCHIAISPKDPIAVVSNYSGGSLALFSLGADGSIANQEDFIQFEGSGTDPKRQSSPHVHSAFFKADGSELYVSDLGTDQIYVYGIEKNGDSFHFKSLYSIETEKGAGPRHIAIGKSGKIIYVVYELTGEIAVFKHEKAGWKQTQKLPMYAFGYKGDQGGADVKISSDHKYVYATNRGAANVVGSYKIKKDGNLENIAIESVGGKSPRNLNFSPSGNWLFFSNQQSNAISIFQRNNKSGKITQTDLSIQVDKPVCVIF